jgi:pimeloyl-ACP methyl ester carboxylesterase
VGFALSGALCALALARAPAGRRLFIGAVTALILVATSGLGAESLTRLAFPDLPKELPAEVRENLDALKSPYAFRRAPAAGPAGMEEVLAAAVEHLDPSQPFTWIGGTTRELPLSLLAWSLFAARGEDAVLWREPDLEQHLWTDPGWDEPAFRKWASRYPQIGTLDPADPLGRTDREFEQRYVTWIAQHPGFELQHRREVQLDGERTHVISIYRRH